MQRNTLIAKVALNTIKKQLEQHKVGVVRFCMFGLEPSLVRSIAKSVLDDGTTKKAVLVKIASTFDPEDKLPLEARDKENQPLTHWRNYSLANDPQHAVLFAASREELKGNEESLEKVFKLETDTLRTDSDAWIDEVGLAAHIDDRERRQLRVILDAANQTQARTIERFADFVIQLQEGLVTQNMPLPKAADYALPSFRLPRNAGDFDKISSKKLERSMEWKQKFNYLMKRVAPMLYKEYENNDSISRETLEANFQHIQDNETIQPRLKEDECDTIRKFIDADIDQLTLNQEEDFDHDWSSAQEALIQLDWTRIKGLFEGVEQRERRHLGIRTYQYFHDEDIKPQLNEADRDLLVGSGAEDQSSSNFFWPKVPITDHFEFFERRNSDIGLNVKLFNAWDRYLYKKPEKYGDFLNGLVNTIKILRDRANDDERAECTVKVTIPRAQKRSFWESKDPSVPRYFAFRYRGLETLLGTAVTLDFGRLWDYFFPEFPKKGFTPNTNPSGDLAQEIKFQVELEHPGDTSDTQSFVWVMPKTAIATALPDDLVYVANATNPDALLTSAFINQPTVSVKGRISEIDLQDINTFQDVFHQNDGKLVNPNATDRRDDFYDALENLVREEELEEDNATTIRSVFKAFVEGYTKTVRDWVDKNGSGMASDSEVVFEQAKLYGQLLEELQQKADDDSPRDRLWSEILRIGIANIGGAQESAIITPWHPLRMVEIAVKTRQAVNLIKQILKARQTDLQYADSRFDQFRRDLKSTYYPELCLGYDGGHSSTFLVTADGGDPNNNRSNYDYSLAHRADSEDTPDISPHEAAKTFRSIGEMYLDYSPHERSNFSVLIYNPQSEALPSALAAELTNQIVKDNDNPDHVGNLQCDLWLTHKPEDMRKIYEQLNVSVDDASESFMASDTARNFLSQLRIGFRDLEDPAGEREDRNHVADLVVLHDVISRKGDVTWRDSPVERNLNLHETDQFPNWWSRRQPIKPADRVTAMYLACPVQTGVSQTYLNTIYRFIEGRAAHKKNVLPVREVSLTADKEIRKIFEKTHRFGEWVVNVDDLVDRRLLETNKIKVIRHFDKDARHITVSTTTPTEGLERLLCKRLNQLGCSDNAALVKKLIGKANQLSGRIVMRAARYGRHANELLGVVLSMEKIRSNFKNPDEPIGWYCLDDHLSLFNERTERIADILAIAPRIEHGRKVLKVVISEAKYVQSGGATDAVSKSGEQLKQTVTRLWQPLNPKLTRPDRQLWLAHLGNLMIEGMKPFELDGNLSQWSDELRSDKIPVQIVGWSHVFVHDADEPKDADEPEQLAEACKQQVFYKQQIRELFDQIGIENESSGADAAIWAEALVSDKTPPDVSPPTKPDRPSPQPDVSPPTKPDRPPPPDAAAPTKPDQPPPAPEVTSETTTLDSWISAGQPSSEEDAEQQAWLQTTVQTLQGALRRYKLTAPVISKRLTPNAALLRFRGSDDLTVAKVEKRRQELLTTYGLEVINILAARKEVVIMVARENRTVLRLQDLWQRRVRSSSESDTNTSLLIGLREDTGKLLYLNVGEAFAGQPAHGPHTLIAGATGTGKSVLVQCLLLDICATNSPNNSRIQVIDPKQGLDYWWLPQMPHLQGEVITDQGPAIDALKQLAKEMRRRYKLFAKQKAHNLTSYNKAVEPAAHLPRLWLFHDEFSDWMMDKQYRTEVETTLKILGNEARAAGITLVFATQRPSQDSFPVPLRANLTNRLILKVVDQRNSELVLGRSSAGRAGAESLLGKGHLLAKLDGEKEEIFAQVPFINRSDTANLVNLIANAWKTT